MTKRTLVRFKQQRRHLQSTRLSPSRPTGLPAVLVGRLQEQAQYGRGRKKMENRGDSKSTLFVPDLLCCFQACLTLLSSSFPRCCCWCFCCCCCRGCRCRCFCRRVEIAACPLGPLSVHYSVCLSVARLLGFGSVFGNEGRPCSTPSRCSCHPFCFDPSFCPILFSFFVPSLVFADLEDLY